MDGDDAAGASSTVETREGTEENAQPTRPRRVSVGTDDDGAADEPDLSDVLERPAPERLRHLVRLLRTGGPTTAEHIVVAESLETASLPSSDVVDALTIAVPRSLSNEDDAYIVVESLLTLMSPAAALDVVRRAARDESSARRVERVAWTMADIAMEQTVPDRAELVAGLLRHESPSWRGAGFRLMHRLDLNEAPELVEQLRLIGLSDGDAYVRWSAAASAISHIGSRHEHGKPLPPNWLELVRAAALEGDDTARSAAADILGDIGEQGVPIALDVILAETTEPCIDALAAATMCIVGERGVQAVLDADPPNASWPGIASGLEWLTGIGIDMQPLGARLRELAPRVPVPTARALARIARDAGCFDDVAGVVTDGKLPDDVRVAALELLLVDWEIPEERQRAAADCVERAVRSTLIDGTARVSEKFAVRLVKALSTGSADVDDLLAELAARATHPAARDAAEAALRENDE